MKHKKITSEKRYTCSMCGKSYRSKDRKFTPSLCSIYKANDGLMTICRDCISSIYNSYLKKFSGDEYNAIKRVCMLLNIYFCDALFEHSANTKMFTNRMNSYLSKINLMPYMNKTFDDYLFSEDYTEPEIKEKKTDTIPDRLVKVWGFGFTLEGTTSAWFTPFKSSYTHNLYIDLINDGNTWVTRTNYTSGSTVTISDSEILNAYSQLGNYSLGQTVNVKYYLATFSGGTHIGGTSLWKTMTIGGTAKVNINGSWKKTIPYVKINGSWEPTISYVNANSSWERGRV